MSVNELFEKARTGDNSAEEQLFQTLSVRFRAFVAQKVRDSDDCGDIVQNAILTISKEYKEIEIRISFSAWAYKVLQNRLLKYFDSTKRVAQHKNALLDRLPRSSSFNPDPTLEASLIKCLHKISKTNQTYARIINLHYQGFHTEDVCKKLQISPNHSYVILSRARSMLKLCLEKGDIEA